MAKMKRISKVTAKRRSVKTKKPIQDCGTKTVLATEVVNSALEGTVLIPLAPVGIQLMGEGMLPVLLLKDETGSVIMPVPLSPLEAGLTLGQSQPQLELMSPHRGSVQIFESLGLKIERAVFSEIRNQKQWLRLSLQGHPSMTSLLVPASGVISLCLHLQVPLFATQELIQKSRVMASELQGMAEGLKRRSVSVKKTHYYLQ